MEYTTKKINKIFNPKVKARAGQIRSLAPLPPTISKELRSLNLHFEQAKHWDKSSAVKRIIFEEKGTRKLLRVLEVYNRDCAHSIKFKLREAEPDEIRKYRPRARRGARA